MKPIFGVWMLCGALALTACGGSDNDDGDDDGANTGSDGADGTGTTGTTGTAGTTGVAGTAGTTGTAGTGDDTVAGDSDGPGGNGTDATGDAGETSGAGTEGDDGDPSLTEPQIGGTDGTPEDDNTYVLYAYNAVGDAARQMRLYRGETALTENLRPGQPTKVAAKLTRAELEADKFVDVFFSDRPVTARPRQTPNKRIDIYASGTANRLVLKALETASNVEVTVQPLNWLSFYKADEYAYRINNVGGDRNYAFAYYAPDGSLRPMLDGDSVAPAVGLSSVFKATDLPAATIDIAVLDGGLDKPILQIYRSVRLQLGTNSTLNFSGSFKTGDAWLMVEQIDRNNVVRLVGYKGVKPSPK
jgi:hypothetical protein